jgi:hypothetical protein
MPYRFSPEFAAFLTLLMVATVFGYLFVHAYT